MSCRTVLYHTILYRPVSYRILPYRIISYLIVSYRIISYRIVSYRILPYRIVSYCIVLYCIVSYRIVSYRIISIISCAFLAYKYIRELLKTKAMAPLESYERDTKHPTRARTCLEFSPNSDAYMECFVEHMTFLVWHPAGSCKMGSDQMAVVTPQLR